MKILKLLFLKYSLVKQGGKVNFLPFFIACLIALSSCSNNLSSYGSVAPRNTAGKNSFVFSVKESFLDKKLRPEDRYTNNISQAEINLLKKLLKQKKYCLNNGSPKFIVTSKQEKIFDMTFAHLIEETHNTKPISPRKYYGKCVSESK